ncbi:MAG: modulator of FtsH protease HflC [Thermotogota bacterium]|nr:modulator of FtsH protease HflC [Thermotogota bacterium]MDK2864623.1 modulator of FtsH protease HflC [Thermotogota bacterium]HCZ06076.1 protease modulator HflC [Thermotogota bacterium]
MMVKIAGIIIVLAVLVLVILPSMFFIVDETKQAVVLRFGEIKQVVTEAGLYVKAPFIDKVTKLEKRFLMYDVKPDVIYTADKKNVVVDTFAIWRISDPKVFIESLKNLAVAKTRIDDVVYSHVRDVFAKHAFDEVVSEKREAFLQEVTNRSRRDLQDFGVEILTVRVKRTDLPEETLNAVFNRMKSERYQRAAAIRAEGSREAEKITSDADRQVRIIRAEAQKKAEELKGEGEATAYEIYANAYSQDPEFFSFWRSLQAYGKALQGDYIILDERSEFLKYLIDPTQRGLILEGGD